MDKIIVIDIEKCLACKSCEIACAVAHSESKDLYDAIDESPRPQRRVTVEAAAEFGIPLQCRHCEAAPCVEICPTGAIHRPDDDSPVVVDNDLCIGCKLCILICPLGVLQLDKKGKVALKCDLCIERLEEGQEPACVEACPTKALKYISLEELTKSKRRRAAKQIAASVGQATGTKSKRTEKTTGEGQEE